MWGCYISEIRSTISWKILNRLYRGKYLGKAVTAQWSHSVRIILNFRFYCFFLQVLDFLINLLVLLFQIFFSFFFRHFFSPRSLFLIFGVQFFGFVCYRVFIVLKGEVCASKAKTEAYASSWFERHLIEYAMRRQDFDSTGIIISDA